MVREEVKNLRGGLQAWEWGRPRTPRRALSTPRRRFLRRGWRRRPRRRSPVSRGLREGSGQGLEPRLPSMQSRLVLPSTKPQGSAGIVAPRCGRLKTSSRYIGTSASRLVSMCATTSTYGSRPEPRSFAFSRPSTWKMPELLFIRISIRIGRSSRRDRHVLDRRRRERVHRDAALLERDAGAALRHVERVGDADRPRRR